MTTDTEAQTIVGRLASLRTREEWITAQFPVGAPESVPEAAAIPDDAATDLAQIRAERQALAGRLAELQGM